MTSFEKEVRKRLRMITLGSILLAAAIGAAFVIRITAASDLQAFSANDLPIFLGMLSGITVTAIVRIVRLKKALRSADALEDLHIQEADERNRIIILKTCRACVTITVTMLAVGAMIALLFSRSVFMILGWVLIAMLALYCMLRAYFTKQ